MVLSEILPDILVRFSYFILINPLFLSLLAKLFHEVILKKYSRSFKYIVFAIIDDHNAKQEHNLDGNIKPFADIFNVQVLSVNELQNKFS